MTWELGDRVTVHDGWVGTVVGSEQHSIHGGRYVIVEWDHLLGDERRIDVGTTMFHRLRSVSVCAGCDGKPEPLDFLCRECRDNAV